MGGEVWYYRRMDNFVRGIIAKALMRYDGLRLSTLDATCLADVATEALKNADYVIEHESYNPRQDG